MDITKLKSLTFDSNLLDYQINSCLNRLLAMHENRYLNGISLVIGNSYQINENGSITIPWNWIE